MTDLPLRADVDYQAGEPAGPYTAALLQAYDNYLQQLGVQAPTTLTIAIGRVTPVMGVHIIDTEAAAADDDLTHIDQTNIPDGAFLIIRPADNARVVTVKHGGGGGGQILLAAAADFVLDDVNKWLWLRRDATAWKEHDRFYAADTATARADIGLGNVSNVKDNLAAAVAPTINDDVTAGYGVGSNWLDTTGGKAYICLDATAAAAVWSGITAGATGASIAEKTDILLNAFRIAVNGGLSVQNMVDGVVDEFTDQTGVDLTASANETWNAAGYYDNPGSYTADQIPTMTSNTAPSGVASASSINAGSALNEAYRAMDKSTASNWAGATTVEWLAYQFPLAKTISQYTITPGSTVTVLPADWTFEGFNGTAWDVLHTVVGETSWVAGVKKTFQFSNSTAYPDYRINMTASAGGTYLQIQELEMMELTPPLNMTLQSVAITALAQPDNVFAILRQQDVDAVTLNTDLTIEASRDGGTTWTLGTLADVSTLTTGRVLTSSINIAAQPVGTSMKWRIKTLNAKSQKIHAVGMEWS